jgi:hypothetical protein
MGALAGLAVSLLPSVGLAMWSVADRGLWPDAWPEPLERVRQQARTLDNGLFAVHEIPFNTPKEFEALWPHLLTVKRPNAPLVLLRGPNKWLGEPVKAGVRLRCRKTGKPTTFELIVDGKIVDLNRIPLPAETPIVDKRFEAAEVPPAAAEPAEKPASDAPAADTPPVPAPTPAAGAAEAGPSAGAAPEVGGAQWLQYRWAQQPHMQLPMVGRVNVDLTGEPPKGVALPALSAKEPLFARWETPMALAGHLWMVLDRSSEDASYDRLFIDADADGSLADEQPVQAFRARVRDASSGRRLYGDFGPVKLLFPGDDGPAAYHVVLSFYARPGYRRLYVISAGWYEGVVTLGGRKVRCTLIDSSANGRFNDTSTHVPECDALRLVPQGEDAGRGGGQFDPTLHFVGKRVEHAGRLYRLTVAPDGSQVAFEAAGDVPTGTVRVADDMTRLGVFGPEGSFLREPADGRVTLPAGTYGMYQWERQRKDPKDDVVWSLLETGATVEPPFTVKAGETTDLALGRDVAARLEVTSRGESSHSINMRLKTEKGDYIRLLRAGQRAPRPKVRIASADGAYDRTFNLEYG